MFKVGDLVKLKRQDSGVWVFAVVFKEGTIAEITEYYSDTCIKVKIMEGRYRGHFQSCGSVDIELANPPKPFEKGGYAMVTSNMGSPKHHIQVGAVCKVVEVDEKGRKLFVKGLTTIGKVAMQVVSFDQAEVAEAPQETLTKTIKSTVDSQEFALLMRIVKTVRAEYGEPIYASFFLEDATRYLVDNHNPMTMPLRDLCELIEDLEVCSHCGQWNLKRDLEDVPGYEKPMCPQCLKDAF